MYDITTNIVAKTIGIDEIGVITENEKIVKIASESIEVHELLEKYKSKDEIKNKINHFHQKQEVENDQIVTNTYLSVVDEWDDVNDRDSLEEVLDSLFPQNISFEITKKYNRFKRDGKKYSDSILNEVIKEYYYAGKTEPAALKSRRLANKFKTAEQHLRNGHWGTAKSEVEQMVVDDDFSQETKDRYLFDINKYMTENDI